MPLTHEFRRDVYWRAVGNPKFRRGLLIAGLETLLSGDFDRARSKLRDYINATCGFAALAEATQIPPKSLMRMFGAQGNPHAANLVAVIAYLQRHEGVQVRALVRPSRPQQGAA